MKHIKVKVDIYRNVFNFDENEEGPQYCYANIRAIEPEQQHQLDGYLTEMIDEKNPLLLNPDLICLTSYNPLKRDRDTLFDTEKKEFQFV
ncbi:hypothetical protein KRX11_08700 [Pasteurellaceae bacterium TAE3-ERU1]|nr:hypothetical protein [Pasteurellaceae bacterium TAE3-ERU1]